MQVHAAIELSTGQTVYLTVGSSKLEDFVSILFNQVLLPVRHKVSKMVNTVCHLMPGISLPLTSRVALGSHRAN